MQYTTYEGPIDCLLSDVVMPEEDGLSFARKFQADRPIPVVMMTGHVPDASICGSLVAENVEVLRKPFRPDELVERVLSAMAE
jgi:CheY-like chemotaxis protein